MANGLVRANAIAILLDAFPLIDTDASNEETDNLLQKQFDLFLVRRPSVAPRFLVPRVRRILYLRRCLC